MIGEVIGQHRIVGKLGQGGMGTVYAAEDTQLGRRVAIKVLNSSVTREERDLERFRTEAKVQARINHPNVVTLYAFEPFRDAHCMVMEYVVGRNLADIVRELGAVPAHIVITVGKQVLEGLAAAHRLGIVHRDLKPSNVMLTPEGVAKVMDFGIAKVSGSKSLTASGDIVGTVLYMSPEQIKGEHVDARSDIYSLGVILFELLTGRVPFKEESDFSIMIHHVQTPPPPPTQFLPDIPGALEDIVLRCLEKIPADRFQRAEEILARFEAMEEQESAGGRSQLYSRRNLAAWLAATAHHAVAGQEEEETPAAEAPPIPEIAASAPPRLQELPVGGPVIGKTRPGARRPLLIAAAMLLLAGAVSAVYFLAPRLASRDSVQEAGVSVPAAAAGPGTAQAVPESAPPAQPGADDPTVPRAAIPAGGAPPPSAFPGPASTPVETSRRRPPVRPSESMAFPTERAIPGPAKTDSPRQAQPVPSLAAVTTPRALFVFMDLDQAGEKLALGAARDRVIEVLREKGHAVLSAGAVSSGVRGALDSGDLAAVRNLGIGYVVLGTALGSLEPQTAYGTTFYVAKVRVSLEVARMTDGRVDAAAVGDAKSRGMANAEAALADALLVAASAASRQLMREWTP